MKNNKILLIDKTCFHCGNTFKASKKEVARGNGKFCSLTCSAVHNNNKRAADNLKIDKICENPKCKKIYHSGSKITRFCSTKCRQEAKRISSPKVPYGQHRSKIQRSVLKFLGIKSDEMKCSICGWNEASCDIHHITSKRLGGTDKFSNLTVLCPNHHRMADRGLIKTLPTIEQVKLNVELTRVELVSEVGGE